MKTRVISFADSLPLFGKVAYSICEGVLGTILIFFLSTALFPLSLAVKIVPWAIGFNSAVTGYSLLNRTQDLFSHKFTYALVAGAVKGSDYMDCPEHNVFISNGRMYLLWIGSYTFSDNRNAFQWAGRTSGNKIFKNQKANKTL